MYCFCPVFPLQKFVSATHTVYIGSPQHFAYLFIAL